MRYSISSVKDYVRSFAVEEQGNGRDAIAVSISGCLAIISALWFLLGQRTEATAFFLAVLLLGVMGILYALGDLLFRQHKTFAVSLRLLFLLLTPIVVASFLLALIAELPL